MASVDEGQAGPEEKAKQAVICEHYKDTGAPHDFRFPCAFPRCPAGVDGFELIVPEEHKVREEWAIVDGKWALAMQPLRVKIYERLRFDKSGIFYWKEREGTKPKQGERG